MEQERIYVLLHAAAFAEDIDFYEYLRSFDINIEFVKALAEICSELDLFEAFEYLFCEDEVAMLLYDSSKEMYCTLLERGKSLGLLFYLNEDNFIPLDMT